MLNNQSITTQMVSVLMGISITIILFGMTFNIIYSIKHERKSFINQSKLEAKLLSEIITAPLAFADLKGVEEGLLSLEGHDDIRYAVVYSLDKKSLVTYNPKKYDIPLNTLQPGYNFSVKSPFPWELGIFKITIKIAQLGDSFGYLYVEKDTNDIASFVENFIFNAFIFLIIMMIFVYLVSKSLSKQIFNPVTKLALVAQNIASKKDYSIRVEYNAKNEIKTLYDAFNELLVDTESLTNNLESRVEERTKELEESLNIIKRTQKQLVESEKMASLGALVSGVAHEVNTPLGNALTGASIIEQEANALLRHFNDGTMKKSIMLDGLTTLSESAKILVLSVKRAANLIKSFKRISVDQSMEVKQKFNLHEYTQEIFVTFHNKLKMVPVKVEISGKEDLVIESYPGAYAQIISNMIQNSLIHGFSKDRNNATIVINIELDGKSVMVTYADNGNGMNKKMSEVAFEPFTTTKRNEGGTGLGLSIVYNLVTQKLNGTIELQTEEGKGVKYIMRLPLQVDLATFRNRN